MDIITGLTIGFLFGFALWKAGALRYSVVIGALLLKDMRLYGFMMTALATIILSSALLNIAGAGIEMGVKPYWGVSQIIGGVLFGIGMAVLGMCPGTCMGRFGTGKYLSIFGILGILSAPFITEAILPVTQRYGLRFERPEKLTVYQQLGVDYLPAVIIFGIAIVIFLVGLRVMEKRKNKQSGGVR